ncbi:hypothetical protein Taro_026161, partial [Colocasia esculenta]|nr:hypothetical protein [Colocasia esculenta]
LKNISLVFWFMISLGYMILGGGGVNFQEIVNDLYQYINELSSIFPQPLFINRFLTYTKKCDSFDKFLPLYLSLRCLNFSKLHIYEEKNVIPTWFKT